MNTDLNSSVAELGPDGSDSANTDADTQTGSDSTVAKDDIGQSTGAQQPAQDDEEVSTNTTNPEEEKEQQRANTRLGIKNKILEGYIEADNPAEYMCTIYENPDKYPASIADEVLTKASKGKINNLEQLQIYEDSTEKEQEIADAYMENPIVQNKLKGLNDFNKTKSEALIKEFAESKGLNSSDIEDLSSNATFNTVRKALEGDGELAALEAAFNAVNPDHYVKAKEKEKAETNVSRNAANTTAFTGGFSTKSSDGEIEDIAKSIFSAEPSNY